jgi:quercetin dioxygenase-like cupin family protein
MNETQFRDQLREQGYSEPMLVTKDALANTTEHTHDFSASALVLEGEINVVTASGTTTCRAGDTFALASGTPHYERYGPDGARFLIGRRVP